jgi:hypothetical protein
MFVAGLAISISNHIPAKQRLVLLRRMVQLRRLLATMKDLNCLKLQHLYI